MNYNTHTLSNGLRIIQLPSASPVVYCGYAVAAGTRDEQPGREGMAHFCEHITFKGTERRSSMKILGYLESVGGDLNAFTNKEETVYHAAVLRDNIDRAVDLLTDIVFHSTYPQAEIDKEVEVIVDEIESYNDSPAELIYDLFENAIYKGHPLGHNILGSATFCALTLLKMPCSSHDGCTVLTTPYSLPTATSNSTNWYDCLRRRTTWVAPTAMLLLTAIQLRSHCATLRLRQCLRTLRRASATTWTLIWRT